VNDACKDESNVCFGSPGDILLQSGGLAEVRKHLQTFDESRSPRKRTSESRTVMSTSGQQATFAKMKEAAN
jgi:hypothetical protein